MVRRGRLYGPWCPPRGAGRSNRNRRVGTAAVSQRCTRAREAAKFADVGEGDVNGIEVAGGAEVSHLLEIGKALRGVRGCSSLHIHLFQHFGGGLRVAL